METEFNINEFVSPSSQGYIGASALGLIGAYWYTSSSAQNSKKPKAQTSRPNTMTNDSIINPSLFTGYWHHGQYVSILRNTPSPSSKSDIKKMLDARGRHRSGAYMKLKGIADAGAGKLIKAPLSGFDCCFVRTEYLGNRVRDASDVRVHQREEIQEVPWGITLPNDNSRIGVITSEADLVIDQTVKEKYVSESVIQAGCKVLVLGWVKESVAGVLTISKPMMKWFVISTKSEDQMVVGYQRMWILYCGTALLFLGAGGVVALKTLRAVMQDGAASTIRV
ncbi:hypothetical protein SmJEL517_g06258 [Synchytrium microbalum]|uniref:RING-type E3 ubiquitin transferase n=1 Tax=Synchytrium microbalum TaxID=1806994 RepID=A0A507BXL7_9FUNG|nr:uncharacterized protein SmJEL517_g06258 [Synchytrium microbalum]TPX30095.1 hypothetical protein SmJEL517_g06258 [Synchytrium microbalum]